MPARDPSWPSLRKEGEMGVAKAFLFVSLGQIISSDEIRVHVAAVKISLIPRPHRGGEKGK